MSSVRRALFLASGERYIIILINLAMVPIIARLMGPAEFGISVLGMAALAIAEAVRDFGGTAYIIQERELTTERVRTSFTITLMWTAVLAGALLLSATPLANFYNEPGLAFYLCVVALSYVVGPFVSPISALLHREMAFGRIATINVTTTLIYALSTIVFATLGFSYMSFAWANFISGTCGMLLCFYFRPDFSIFRISLIDWRTLVNFGGYKTGAHLLLTLWDYIPYLIFGRLLDAAAVGLYNRAQTLSQIPKKAILGGIAAIVLPIFSATAREDGDLKGSYLRAATFVTAVQWPSLAVLAVLASPIVNILLGPNWQGVAPLVSIIAAASMFNFSANLTPSVLLTSGGVRSFFLLNLIVVPLSILLVAVAAHYGVTMVAWAMFVIAPMEIAVSLYVIRRVVPFSLRELFAALWPSAVVTVFTLAGPVAAGIANGGHFNLPFLAALGAMVLAGIGWVFGLWFTKHPLWDEIILIGRAGLGRMRRGEPIAANT
ncbi:MULTISPECIES: lipopolysaccharide biosynthesis protein [Rhodomicrobium]|uniref:lipopolysaccharide biosynthesis protein n=1 Tax=Rhodomicrobium TaxID=1068 RepID=UPI000B4A5597|nr:MULTISPECIES: lipopolysaccharide biosynthesis protein [Rhodomicrobium]